MFSKKPEFIAATCPNCGGRLELDANFEVAYCADCGTQCIIKHAKKRMKKSSLDKIIDFTERQQSIRRQDKQELERKEQIRKQENEEKRRQRKEETNLWWSKHWLKVVVIGLIVIVISLVYDYFMTH